jgi:ring-1,2-phenylacetyl-CoA epoxidase subunit PaaE
LTATPVADAPAAHRRATIHPLRVQAVEPLTDDSVVIEFEVPAELGSEFAFTHGQHVSLRCEAAGDDTRRSYSICSAAGSGRLRVAVKRLPGGIFSEFAMEQLSAGDVVEVVTPIGHFNTPLDPSHETSYAMIAAGSGIAPILSNVTTILAVEPRSTVTLIYGNRTVKDIMFLEELEDLKNQHRGRFHLTHSSRESADWVAGELTVVRCGNGKPRLADSSANPPPMQKPMTSTLPVHFGEAVSHCRAASMSANADP